MIIRGYSYLRFAILTHIMAALEAFTSPEGKIEACEAEQLQHDEKVVGELFDLHMILNAWWQKGHHGCSILEYLEDRRCAKFEETSDLPPLEEVEFPENWPARNMGPPK